MTNNVKIEKTKDYKQFKIMKGNRIVSRAHVKKLIKSIAEHDMLSQNPIIVNTNGEIVDGQHRLLAAENLGVDIYYVQVDPSSLHDVITLNNYSKKWSSRDYIDAYIALGYPSYKQLVKFMEDEDISLEIAFTALCGNNLVQAYRDLYRGAWKMSDEQIELAKKRIFNYKRFKLFFNESRGMTIQRTDRYFYRAINRIVELGYEEQIFKNLESYAKSHEIEMKVTTKDYLRQYEDILNFRKHMGAPSVIRLY